MIVVTAATGLLGQLVVDGLLRSVPAEQIAVAVRNPDKAAVLAARGVTVRAADYDDPASLRAARSGADQVLFISGGGGPAYSGMNSCPPRRRSCRSSHARPFDDREDERRHVRPSAG